MKKNISAILFVFTIPALMIVTGCDLFSTDDVTNVLPENWETATQVTYDFNDAAVPPEHHRSYIITVTADKVTIVVDCYGDVLADEEYDITADQFVEIKASIVVNGLGNCNLAEDDGCTGGTSERVTYSDTQNELFSGRVYHCASRDYGNLCGNVDAFADDVEALIPDLAELLQ